MKARKAARSNGAAIDIGPRYIWTEGRCLYWEPDEKKWIRVDATKARLYFSDGRIAYYDDQALAYFVWLHLPKGIGVAFRGRNDTRPVYPWDCVDRLPGRDP